MTAASTGIRPTRVLVVEDERATAALLEFTLRKAGYQVQIAPDGEHALLAAEQFSPDAVLLDLGLPGLMGLEVLKRLRSKPENATLVIVVLTASTMESAPADVMEAGANSHCTKPIAPRTLLRKLQELGVPPTRKEDG
jgi:DNA-binding response OmpR family regulator